MPQTDDVLESDFSISAAQIVQELFVRTADENYITARWCARRGLHFDFFWLSSHALEKYLKGILLLNQCSAKDYSHELPKLLVKAREIAGDLLPVAFQRPTVLPNINWRCQDVDQFAYRLFQNGKSDNRYGVYGYYFRTQDIYMLDQLVFAARRLIVPLRKKVPTLGGASLKCSYREFLSNFTTYFKISSSLPLEKLINSKEEDLVRQTLLDFNEPFAPDDYAHPSSDMDAFSMCTSVIDRCVLDPLASEDEDQARLGIRVADWLISNVKLPKEVRLAIDSARAKCAIE